MMAVEIEYYKGDTLLYGAMVSFESFKLQMKTIENLYDRGEDNFVDLLCRMYHWTVSEVELKPDYIYDRDTGKCRKNK